MKYIDIIIIVCTYLFVDGVLGLKLFEIADNLYIYYMILFVIYCIFSLFPLLYGALLGAVGGNEISNTKLATISGMFVGAGLGIAAALVAGVFLIFKLFIVYYLTNNISVEASTFNELSSEVIVALVVLAGLIIKKFFTKK